MPITHRSTRSFAKRACVLAGLLLMSGVATRASTDTSAAVAVVRNVAWSPGDAQRDGASEFEIFLKVAQLQAQAPRVGLVGVGNHNGRLSSELERALEHVALRGIPVARVARNGGEVVVAPDALVIDASELGEKEAETLLVRCLQRYGAPPSVANPDSPTEAELAAIRKHLERYKEVFTTARSASVAQG